MLIFTCSDQTRQSFQLWCVNAEQGMQPFFLFPGNKDFTPSVTLASNQTKTANVLASLCALYLKSVERLLPDSLGDRSLLLTHSSGIAAGNLPYTTLHVSRSYILGLYTSAPHHRAWAPLCKKSIAIAESLLDSMGLLAPFPFRGQNSGWGKVWGCS